MQRDHFNIMPGSKAATRSFATPSPLPRGALRYAIPLTSAAPYLSTAGSAVAQLQDLGSRLSLR